MPAWLAVILRILEAILPVLVTPPKTEGLGAAEDYELKASVAVIIQTAIGDIKAMYPE